MLTKHEFRACQVLLSAARRGADFDETKSELSRRLRAIVPRTIRTPRAQGPDQWKWRRRGALRLRSWKPAAPPKRDIWPAIPERRSNGGAA